MGHRRTRAGGIAGPGADAGRGRPCGVRRILGVLSVLVALFASGCSSTADRPGEASMAALPKATPKALGPYYKQRLRWQPCRGPAEDFDCATMTAPLDYDHPTAGDIDLAVARKKTTGHGRRLGSLLVNPGGPGGSAVDYLQSYAAFSFPAEIRDRYDMVAVDPRGVAHSSPVTCLTGPQTDTYTATDTTPDDARETRLLISQYKRFAAGCDHHSARLLPHVSTVEAARDMDVLRAALGDSTLSFVGLSYGTFLGATYAGLYPHRVGRLVLDGAMDPSLSAREINLEQTAGFDTAFRSFARDCVRHQDCPLGGKGDTVPTVSGRLAAYFHRLDAHPVPTGSRPLTEALATTGVLTAMYDEGAWPRLRLALTAAMRRHDGTGLLTLSDAYYERGRDGRYANLLPANAAVNCLDLPAPFTSPDQVAAAVPAFREASPVFGEGLAWAALACGYWPARATGTPHRIEAGGAAPILVVGTTRDPATPYRWARALAAQLDSATLLTYDGDGHTAYGRGSRCVDTAVNRYLLHGTLPTAPARCA